MSTAEQTATQLEPRPGDVVRDDSSVSPEEPVLALMLTDPVAVRKHKARREKSPSASRDEVWEGVYVMSPMADFGHQRFVGKITAVLTTVVDESGGGDVLPGVNVSDRIRGWRTNYRVPDVAVYLPGNPAILREAFACGGPDFAVEILSEGDLARKKLEFYTQIKTREVVLLDRDPWALELYRLAEGSLVLVGISTPDRPDLLASEVLPLTFRLMPGESRPTIVLARLDGGQSWRI